MKLIFDSGSTSTVFAAVTPGNEPRIHSLAHGHNAVSAPGGALTAMLAENETIGRIAGKVTSVDFYGAGCTKGKVSEKVAAELTAIFPEARIRVESDMLCAARALCGDRPGIACILGTGANSCLWDGERITANVSPLGFILGDEGSGAVLGRLFLGKMLKQQFPEDVSLRFDRQYGMTTHDIVEHVYRSERPGAFLASFAPFILEEARRTEAVREFVTEEFRRFLRYNVAAYDGSHDIPVGFVGSVAWHFREYLAYAVEAEHMHLGEIIKDPLPILAAQSLKTVQ